MRRRGTTLIELLVALAITGFVAAALSRVMVSAAKFVVDHPESVAVVEAKRAREAQIQNLLREAYLTPDATDRRAFFVASTLGNEVGDPDTLTFTTLGAPLDGKARDADPEDTFESLQQEIGPQGGVAEVSLSTTPVGDTSNQGGLILRVQRPADGDPSQGGREQVVVPDVRTATFEFWNGLDWVTLWDTRQGDRRLPALVRVTLGTESDPQAYVVTAALRYSDVTQTNPTSQGGAG